MWEKGDERASRGVAQAPRSHPALHLIPRLMIVGVLKVAMAASFCWSAPPCSTLIVHERKEKRTKDVNAMHKKKSLFITSR